MYSFHGRIVNWAEEIDQRLSGDELVRGLVDSCVSETDSGRASHQTFQIFQKIVRIVLECDQNGLGEFLHYSQQIQLPAMHLLLLTLHFIWSAKKNDPTSL